MTAREEDMINVVVYLKKMMQSNTDFHSQLEDKKYILKLSDTL